MVKTRYLFLSDPDTALKTYIVVLRDHLDFVMEKISRLGVFEPIVPEELSEKTRELKEYIELVEDCKKIFESLNTFIEEPISIELKEIPYNTRKVLADLRERLKDILLILQNLNKKKVELENDLNKLNILKNYLLHILNVYPNADTTLIDYEGDLIVSKTLYGLRTVVEDLEKKAMYVIAKLNIGEQNVVATLVFDKKIAEDMLKGVIHEGLHLFEVANRYGVKPINELIKDLDELNKKFLNELENLKKNMNEIVNKHINDIALLKALIEAEHTKIELLKTALESKHLALITGWTLRSRKEVLIEELKDFQKHVIFEEDPEPPVDFNNLEPFKPFEMFTELNGYPSPREWDPTPLLTYLYAIYFALMFPDIGYAIGLLIGSKFVLPYFVQNPNTLQKLRRIIYVTAACATITGLLSGNFLGSLIGQYISSVIRPLIPSPPPRLTNIQMTISFMMSSIKLALLIGYASVIIAHIIGFAKAFVKMKDIWTSILELCMVLIIIFGPAYITNRMSFIGMNVDVLNLGKILPITTVEYVTYASLALLILCKVKTSGAMGGLFWIFDLIGPLADVMSFVRIAGIGAGSALLVEIFNSFADSIIKSLSEFNLALGIMGGIVFTLLLHTFVLATSVLGPYIHSLRLITYEVASKFYEGSGRRISPIKVWLGSIILGGKK